MGGPRTPPLPAAPTTADKPRPVSVHDVFDAAGYLLHEQLANLRKLGTVTTRAVEAGDATPAVLREAAGIARAICLLSAEIRQREKHVHRKLDKMTAEERLQALLSAVSELPAGDRARVRELLDELDAGPGVLS